MMMGGVMQSSQSGSNPLEVLVQMGFARELAVNALEATGNDLDHALQLLVDQREVEERHRRASAADARASKAPRQAPSNGIHRAQPLASPPAQPSKVSAAGAPMPAKQGLMDLALQFAERAQVVDTLHYVLKTILENPSEAKYRALKTTNVRFAETLGKDPRTSAQVENFMKAIGFERAGEWLTLPPNHDRLVLKTAMDAMDNIQTTDARYSSAKRTLEFERALEMSKATANEEERARRAIYAAKVPPVPAEGAAGTTRVSVIVSEGSPPLFRRFAADDTLADVMNWIGSERSIVCRKILDGSWSLVDETLLQKRPLDMNAGDLTKTLHALQLWPSATLHVRLNRSAS